VHYFDDEERQDQESLGRIYPGKQARVVSRDKSRNKLIVRVESPSSSPAYYYFDIAKNVYAPLGSAYPQLDGMTLSETRPIAYQARDGLRIDGYLTVPKGAEARRLPLIVHPHGGPAARDAMTYSYWVQYFASRGWAVLQMNFRGSEGYGDAFENAGRGQWGRAMQDDVTDGVRWAVAEGLADPDRICIVGASYGGYVALWGAASTPELYRCAVSLNGVSDIRAMINDARHYTNFMLTRDYLAHEDPDAVAPVRHADKVRVPVLVGYGTKDRSVGPDQSTAMIAALRRAGKPVAAVELEGGDHYLTHERHRVQFFQAMDAFLQEHLGLGPVPSAAVAADK
jgi:dipeptidyl aminopeptidase/acylaminoacyl peptidase